MVLDNYDRNYLIKLNKATHYKGLGFLYAGNLGLYGFTFIDFGESHRIFDATGEESKTVHIAGITKEEKGLVCLHEEKRNNSKSKSNLLTVSLLVIQEALVITKQEEFQPKSKYLLKSNLLIWKRA